MDVEYLEKTIRDTLSELEGEHISVTNYRLWVNKLDGVLTSLNTTLGSLQLESKEAREKFESRYSQLKKRMPESEIFKTDPLGYIFKLLLDYVDNLRVVGTVQQLTIALLYAYNKKLEKAMDEVQGIELSTEFLRRIESFTRDLLEKGIVAQQAEYKAFNERLVEQMEKQNEALARLVEAFRDVLIRNHKVLQELSKATGGQVQALPLHSFPQVPGVDSTREQERVEERVEDDELPREDRGEGGLEALDIEKLREIREKDKKIEYILSVMPDATLDDVKRILVDMLGRHPLYIDRYYTKELFNTVKKRMGL